LDLLLQFVTSTVLTAERLVQHFKEKILSADKSDTWKLYLFLEHQYQLVPSFVLTAAILVYPYLQLKYCLCTSNRNQHALMLFNGNRFRHTASSVPFGRIWKLRFAAVFITWLFLLNKKLKSLFRNLQRKFMLSRQNKLIPIRSKVSKRTPQPLKTSIFKNQ